MTLLGIPVIIHEECLNGLVAEYASSQAHPIAMAGTFKPEFIERVYAIEAYSPPMTFL